MNCTLHLITTVTSYYLSKTKNYFLHFFNIFSFSNLPIKISVHSPYLHHKTFFRGEGGGLGLIIILEFDFDKWQSLQHLINSSWNNKWNSSFLMKFIWDYLRHLSWFRKTKGIFHKGTVVNRALPFLHGGSLEIRHTITWSTDTYSVIFSHLYIALFIFKLQR